MARFAHGFSDVTEKTPHLATGDPKIDPEHRAIDEALERLLAAVADDDAAASRALGSALLKMVAAHFAHEERLMKSIRYDGFARHKRAHDAFLFTARQVLRSVRQKGIGAPFLLWVTRAGEWFESHAMKEDLALAVALRACRLPVQDGDSPDVDRIADLARALGRGARFPVR